MIRRDGRKMLRVPALRGSIRTQAPAKRAAKMRSAVGYREGDTEVRHDFAKNAGALAQWNGAIEGTLYQEPNPD